MEDRASERESLVRPGELKRARERVSFFFYMCIGISSLSSFMCGFSLGFSSPTLVAFYKVGWFGAAALVASATSRAPTAVPFCVCGRLDPLPFCRLAPVTRASGSRRGQAAPQMLLRVFFATAHGTRPTATCSTASCDSPIT